MTTETDLNETNNAETEGENRSMVNNIINWYVAQPVLAQVALPLAAIFVAVIICSPKYRAFLREYFNS